MNLALESECPVLGIGGTEGRVKLRLVKESRICRSDGRSEHSAEIVARHIRGNRDTPQCVQEDCRSCGRNVQEKVEERRIVGNRISAADRCLLVSEELPAPFRLIGKPEPWSEILHRSI